MVAERLLAALVLGTVALLGTGCAGARTTVVADDAAYPISLSRAVRDADGTIVAHERTVVVGTFHDDSTAWGLLYTAIRINPRTNISSSVNEQVAAVGGEAIVNLRVKNGQCAFNLVPVMSIVPFWPGCTSTVIEGDIVKVVR